MSDGTTGLKVDLLPGWDPDLTACTFSIENEDHTLGNVLRWMIMQDPDVEFCGYSAPHPSEPKIHLRIQTLHGKSCTVVMRTALEELEKIFSSLGEKYEDALSQYSGRMDTD
ncbi:RBP11-like subunits of RNA polymerase [Atractiella rhizophila]|nr:RBP11-like subunits of RNA polymerase [Atractiella rhizophila]